MSLGAVYSEDGRPLPNWGAVLRDPRPRWRLPARYQLSGQEPLGRGASGEVWEALDEVTGCSVAVKHIAGFAEDLVGSKRLLREIGILRRLSSGHVVRLRDVCIPVGNRPEDFAEIFLVFDRCDGDLRQLLKAGAPLPAERAASLVHGVLQGLRCLHLAGVLHRDLKPANCLLRAGAVQLADLGLARQVLPEASTAAAAPSSGSEVPPEAACRTPLLPAGLLPPPPPLRREVTRRVASRWYRAPEVMLLGEDYSGAIDIWAAGCIFGELLQLVPHGGATTPLFPGAGSAMSPPASDSGSAQADDMLSVILQVVGRPPDEDLSCLGPTAEAAVRRAAGAVAEGGAGTLEELLHAAPAPALGLLRRLLAFGPLRRPTAQEALSHELFRDLPAPEALAAPELERVTSFEVSDEDLRDPVQRPVLALELRRRLAKEIEGWGGTGLTSHSDAAME
uniref:Protein kinase domain-containing protein n=1 Tax=Pyrodinium bahamense TaxID=73915 RepID=A0A7S0APF4_9DINO